MSANTKINNSVSDQLRIFLTNELVDLPIGKIDIVETADHTGESILQVVVRHKLSKKPLNSRTLFQIDGRARDLAWALGERRFLHFRHIYDKKQEIAA